MGLSNARGAREYGKFRETKHGRTAVAIVNDDEANIETLEVLTSGDTEMLPAPGETSNYVIKGFHFSNADSSAILVYLKSDTDAPKKFVTKLAASGNFDKNLEGRYWRLPLNKPLIVNLSANGDVWVTIEYELEAEPAEEAVNLTDSITFAESLIKDTVKGLTDSITITEAFTGKAIVKALSDSLVIAESVANTTTLSISDDLVIAESEIEGTAPSLEDSITFAEDLTITTGKGLSDAQAIAESAANKPTVRLSDEMATDDSQIVIVHTPG